MAKISAEARKKYSEQLKSYKSTIEQIEKRESNLAQVVAQGGPGLAYKRIALAEENLNLVSYFILLNSFSLSLLGVKNEEYLNHARKGCYKALIRLEEVLSNMIDVPFSDYEDRLTEIADYSDESRFTLLRKLGYSIQSVVEGFGDNSKWKWSFVELDGRYATVAKNFLNLKTFTAGMDPRIEGYETRMAHLKLVKELLQNAADGYRQKYELSTRRIDDFKLALSYLSALRRIHSLLAEPEEAESLKRKIEIWKTKMDNDSLKLEQSKKASARSGQK